MKLPAASVGVLNPLENKFLYRRPVKKSIDGTFYF